MDVLCAFKSQYQHIFIISEGPGNVGLLLDGDYQTTLPNNDYYDIMLGGNYGMKTAILGGGDMTSLPVLASRGVTDFKIYELDPDVIKACIEFSDFKQTAWDNVVIGDAIEKLRNGEIKAEHIIIDLLSFSKLNLIESTTPTEILDLVCEHAEKYITGFVTAGVGGIVICAALEREFVKRGWTHYTFCILDSDECFFAASKEYIEWPEHLERYAIRYPVHVKDSRIMSESFENIIEIVTSCR